MVRLSNQKQSGAIRSNQRWRYVVRLRNQTQLGALRRNQRWRYVVRLRNQTQSGAIKEARASCKALCCSRSMKTTRLSAESMPLSRKHAE